MLFSMREAEPSRACALLLWTPRVFYVLVLLGKPAGTGEVASSEPRL